MLEIVCVFGDKVVDMLELSLADWVGVLKLQSHLWLFLNYSGCLFLSLGELVYLFREFELELLQIAVLFEHMMKEFILSRQPLIPKLIEPDHSILNLFPPVRV